MTFHHYTWHWRRFTVALHRTVWRWPSVSRTLYQSRQLVGWSVWLGPWLLVYLRDRS